MDKETKELLKRTLSMTDDKLLLKFAKSYAAKDQAFAEAIIEKFLPAESTVDYEKMVHDCFLHKKKGGKRRYGPSLDWAVIRRDIKRLLKQLDFLRQQQNGETAAEGAVFFLETLAKEFHDDCVYEDYNYENSNFGDCEALEIVDNVLLHDDDVTRDKKMGLLKRLEKLAKDSVYQHYLPCDIDEVVDHAKQLLLSPEDLLKETDKSILTAKNETDKAYYVKWKVKQLRELGRNEEAEKVITQYLQLDAISVMRFEQLVADSRYDEAKAFCKERTVSKDGEYRNTQQWRERLLELAQQIGDVETVREMTGWLFAKGNVRQDDKKEYYRICRETFDAEKWPAYRDKMLNEGMQGNADTNTVFQLFEEEKLFDRMYQYLQNLSDGMGYYSWDLYSNSGGERLHYFAKYAHALTQEQRKEMVAAFAKTILQDSRRVSDRKGYYRIASGLRLLSESCEEGSLKARSLAEQILRENPSKPAYREEISQYDK